MVCVVETSLLTRRVILFYLKHELD
jgi:hypothetical protein